MGTTWDALYEDVEIDDLRVFVIAGPVFGAGGQVYRGVGLSQEDWKLLAYCKGRALHVAVFLLTQDLDRLRALITVDEFRLYQVSLAEIQERTGLVFDAALHEADVYARESAGRAHGTADFPPLEGTADIHG